MFVISGVSKRYRSRTRGRDAEVIALDRVTLTLPERRTTVLLGSSGSGKTTLLRTLNGLVVPDEGTVRFAEQEVTPRTAPMLRRRMGYVVQGGGLFPHLTARENVALLARELGWPQPKREERARELCALARLPVTALDRYPAELSGGQAQRVSLLRALMLDPDVLLLDEALGALDPVTRHALQGDLRALFTAVGKTVVLVTHDLEEARFFADSVVVMREGRIEQIGPWTQLLGAPATPFVRDFVAVAEARP